MINRFCTPVRSSLLAAASLSALLLAAPARADIVLDTFAPGDVAAGQNWSLLGVDPAFGLQQSLAVPFTLTSAVKIDDILASITGTGGFQIGVVAGAGLPTGAYVYSTTLSEPMANVSLSGLGWALQAGEYWLVSKANAGSEGIWQGGDSNLSTRPWAFTSGADANNWFFTGDTDAPGARITVSAIPEPGTWALMAGGLLLVGALSKRRTA